MTMKSTTFSRRNLLKGGTAMAAVALAGAPGINLGYYTLFEGTPHAQKFSGRAIRLMDTRACPDGAQSRRRHFCPTTARSNEFLTTTGSGR